MEKYLNKIKSIVDNNGFSRTHIDDINESVLFEAAKPKPKNTNQPKEATDPSSKEGISNALASEFFSRCRALATTTHFAHLSTDSFSEHSALATFYDDIIDSIDTFCEAYIGQYGKFLTLPPIAPEMTKAVDAIIEMREWVAKNRSLISDDSSLQNLIDGTVELCNTTIYKLQKLK